MYKKDVKIVYKIRFIYLDFYIRLCEVYYVFKKYVKIEDVLNEVVVENIMVYFLGILFVILGEIIN